MIHPMAKFLSTEEPMKLENMLSASKHVYNGGTGSYRHHCQKGKKWKEEIQNVKTQQGKLH